MMKEGKNKLNEELLAKFLMGECSEEELREVNTWLNESDDNARELFRIEEIYHLGKSGDSTDEKKIEKAEKQLFKRLAQEEAKQFKVRRMHTWMKYAAMFIGIFLVSGLSYHIYQSQSEEQLVAVVARDEVKELMLPDGTKVWLNKHTTLKYPREFSEKERNVYMEGEGYFEVKRNVEKPFIVRSEAMQVRVLGTVFNLKSDKMNRSAVATLIKGEIEVKGNHNEGMIVLAPGQKAELNAVTRRLVVKQVDTGIENWHNNQFVFENADIFTIDELKFKRALKEYASLKNTFGIDRNESTHDSCLDEFTQNKLLYTIVNTSDLKKIDDSGVTYGIIPVPYLSEGLESVPMSITTLAVVNPYTSDISVAKTVARAISYDYAADMQALSGHVSARADLIKKGRKADNTDYNMLHDIYSDSIVKAKYVGVQNIYTRYEILIHQIWDGKSIDDAYNEFHKGVESFLTSIR